MSAPAEKAQHRVRALFDALAPQHRDRHRRGALGWLAARDLKAFWALLGERRGQSALDMGCGSGRHAQLLQAAGLSVCAVDLSEAMIAQVRPHVTEALVGDVETLRLGRRFDAVVCLGVLLFLRDPEPCLANLAAHARAGGVVIIETPRRSLGGHLYKVGYRLSRDLHIHLHDRALLDRIAARHGLAPQDQRRPFFHSLFRSWRKLG